MTEALVVGDPEGMRALARELTARAEILRAAHAAPSKRLEGATFEGPAADRVRASAGDLGTRVMAICSDVEATAQALIADAGVVERRNEELRAAAERADEERASESGAAATAGSKNTKAAEPAASSAASEPAQA